MNVTVELTDDAAVALVQLIDDAQDQHGYSEVLDDAWLALMDAVGALVVCQRPIGVERKRTGRCTEGPREPESTPPAGAVRATHVGAMSGNQV